MNKSFIANHFFDLVWIAFCVFAVIAIAVATEPINHGGKHE